VNFKLELIFKDRVGVVADVSAVIARRGLNIASMEVVRRSAKAHVYVETENSSRLSERRTLFQVLGQVPDLIEIRFIDTLPQEARTNRFRVVLDNIRDGVLSIDAEGRITIINEMAREALGCTDQDVVGANIKSLNMPDFTILDCLRGKTFSNVTKNQITPGGRFQYLSTGRPIFDSEQRIIGAVEIAKDVQEIKKLARQISEPEAIGFSDIIGRNPAITAAIAFAQKIAASDSIVSLRGASGTGKELFARAIHGAGSRPGAFVPINCAALPEHLLESELFGYAPGTFTGGVREGKPGLFEIAKNGTVLLDEIAEVPLNFQGKILRVIQDRRIRRIGGRDEIQIDTRIITATNRNLEGWVETQRFRTDLYYRINVLPIHIPPLKERRDDIPLLVDHFLFQLGSKLDRQISAVTPAALDKLYRHDWPGNVRELRNVVERAAILCEGERVDVNTIHFSHELGRTPAGDPSPSAIELRQPLKTSLGEYEKMLVTQALEQAPSIRQAARRLGISHTALRNKIKKYGLQ